MLLKRGEVRPAPYHYHFDVLPEQIPHRPQSGKQWLFAAAEGQYRRACYPQAAGDCER